ncbi:two-component system OmpR family sensor kinase [Kitasatospora sp. MAA4]|uniref:sensor histidine kinase n=1 Tax=Kitasatospora sp. MAA4 TaxID=3035093 RepID=UPI00247465F1|nr:HAMP domain-containing sensor histidine kinase [Kitasatospora sp. MAA4]MDH6134122.1 two-component system OmpR family sensor kinase [Kitasatospora sp. MAA4]
MMTSTARIRRLRRRLTALFTLTSAVGLIGLAAFAIHTDDQSWRKQLDDALTLQTRQAILLLSFDQNGRIDAQYLQDGMETGCPPVTVVSGPADRTAIIYTPRQPCVRARTEDLEAAAAAAIGQGTTEVADARSENGHQIRLLAEPYTAPDGQSTAGAVVAAGDTTGDQAAHRRLTLLLTAGCAVLVTLSAVAGHLLSGRAIRPALTALQQQEEFLADAAHDLRTPAASLRSLAETALRDDDHRTAALERTVRLATRMGDLIDGLLTRARLTAGVGTLASQPLRLDQLVEAVVDDTESGEHHVSVRTEPVIVVADPDLLRRAVANLLSNALRHGHAPGRPAEVELTVAADGTVTVDDAGPGVPPALAGSLFQRYRSGSGSTGLGLSIASWIAHSHDGTLDAGSSPRGGARFTLRIPPRAK